MKDFKKTGSFGGNRGGGNFGRPNAGRPSFNNDRRRDSRFGPPEMHEAICAKCGNKCQVPFRPNDKKPVYCKECFDEIGGSAGGGGDRFVKRDFGARFPAKSGFEEKRGGNTDQTTRQLEAINSKLERLIQAVQNMSSSRQPNTEVKEVKKEESPKEIPAIQSLPKILPKKVSKKKAVKK